MLWITILNLVLTWTLCARHYFKNLTNVLITALSHKHYHLPHTTEEKVEAEGKRLTCCTAIAEIDIWMQAASIQILCITRQFYFLTVQLASRKSILYFIFYFFFSRIYIYVYLFVCIYNNDYRKEDFELVRSWEGCVLRRWVGLLFVLLVYRTFLNAWGKNKLRKTSKLGSVMSKS